MTDIVGQEVETTLRVLVVGMSGLPAAIEPMITELGIDIELCPTLEDSFAELAWFKPHIAIVDPELSELGGIGAIRAVRFLAPQCGVVLTGEGPESMAVEAVKAGALECLTKPIDWVRLRQLLVRVHARLELEWATATLQRDGGAHHDVPARVLARARTLMRVA